MVTKTKQEQVITLASGETFDLPWSPVEPVGQGAGKQWRKVSEDMWKELFDRLHDYSTKDRNEVMALYKRSYQSLHKVYGTVIPRSEREVMVNVPDSPEGMTVLKRINYIRDQISTKESEIEALKVQLAELADDGMAQLRQQLEALEAMKNETLIGDEVEEVMSLPDPPRREKAKQLT